MKKLFLVLSFLFFNINYGQINLSAIEGYWIKYKGEMKDGSDLSDGFTEDSGYMEYRINQRKLCINSNPVHKVNESCLDFTLINNFMKTSQYSGFVVEKATKDSLVLCEKIDGLADDKLKRAYFVRQEVIISKFKEENKNEKNIVASKLFAPKTNGTIEIDLNKAFKNNYSNFELVGNLKIYPDKKRIKTEITFSTQKDSSRIRLVKKVIDGTFEKWNLKDFKDYESIEIPFVLKSEITKTFWGISVIFFTTDLTEFERIYGVEMKDIRKSSDYFNKGLIAYEEKKYLESIAYFSESYKFNSKNIDALYNKAAIYFESGDKENACKVWLEISILGQVEGKQLFLKNCE
ncbi:tetratricopeptide repeat protein [Flavobacterium chungangensis]|uniref:Tol-pal system YbgF family protein n=1 Tax=Flavobacterium chungangensis TaxID=2708132 RepID=A0ABV8ZK95_9FLAO